MMQLGEHSSLSTGLALRWMPPLVITEEQVNETVSALANVLEMIEPD